MELLPGGQIISKGKFRVLREIWAFCRCLQRWLSLELLAGGSRMEVCFVGADMS